MVFFYFNYRNHTYNIVIGKYSYNLNSDKLKNTWQLDLLLVGSKIWCKKLNINRTLNLNYLYMTNMHVLNSLIAYKINKNQKLNTNTLNKLILKEFYSFVFNVKLDTLIKLLFHVHFIYIKHL